MPTASVPRDGRMSEPTRLGYDTPFPPRLVPFDPVPGEGGEPSTTAVVANVCETPGNASSVQTYVELGRKLAVLTVFCDAPSFMLVAMFVPGPVRWKYGKAEQPPGPEKSSW